VAQIVVLIGWLKKKGNICLARYFKKSK